MGKKIKILFVIAVVLLFAVASAGCISNNTQNTGGSSIPSLSSTPVPTQTQTKVVTGHVGDIIESYVSGDHIAWKVSNVIRGPEANRIVAEGNMFNEEPDPGYEFILYEITVVYLGTETYSVYPSTWKLYANGVEADYAYLAVLPSAYKELSMISIREGGVASGWIVKTIPIGSDARVYFEPMFSFTSDAVDCFIYL
ncbi:MAG: hypothetical protein PHR89_05110 [Bacilli bacterium]|nr:hypothetical protein [Bacilli bacterium]